MFEEELGTAGEGGCWFGSVEECGGNAGVHGVELSEACAGRKVLDAEPASERARVH